MGSLYINDLTSVKKVIDTLNGAMNDWPNPVVTLGDFEFEVSTFIGKSATKTEIASVLKNIDFSKYSWQAESLSQLLGVFDFYGDTISLQEIIEDLKGKLEQY